MHWLGAVNLKNLSETEFFFGIMKNIKIVQYVITAVTDLKGKKF